MRFPKNFRSRYAVKCLCVISILLFAGVVMAKDFWETKVFSQWTQKECQKLLTDSPWARDLTLTGSNISSGYNNPEATDSQAPNIKYMIQLRSAAPLRQAIVRQNQIENKYDSFTDEQKQSFDKNMESVLNGQSQDYIVVYISFDTNNTDFLRELNRHWEMQTTELLKNTVFLSASKSKGDRIPIAQYIPGASGSQEFQFIFPRYINGSEIIKSSDKGLILEFNYPLEDRWRLDGNGKGFIEFKTDKMKINNEVVY